MEPQLIATFRKLFALDDKTLPDSMTPEDFGKFIEEQAGNLFVKPEDFKNLQRVLSEKDKLSKELEIKLKELETGGKKIDAKDSEEIAKLREEIKVLTGELGAIAQDKKIEKLKVLYPDIHPSLLVGKSDEDIEKLVAEQRKIAQSIYGDSKIFTQPNYDSVDDIEKAKKNVEANKEMSAIDKAAEILRLNRLKSLFNK